jgi:hypothetical protein
MRALWAVILNMIAVILYGVGLLSPLTPSEGIPNMGEIFVFAIIPVVFLGVSGFLARSWGARAIVIIELSGVVAFSGWLLEVQWRTS